MKLSDPSSTDSHVTGDIKYVITIFYENIYVA